LLGLLLSPSCTPSTTAISELLAPPPYTFIGTSVDPSCTVLLLHSHAAPSSGSSGGSGTPPPLTPSSVVVSKDVVSYHKILISAENGHTQVESPVKKRRSDSPIICMTLMHQERILITANKKEQIEILDLLATDPKGNVVSRGKVVTGGDDEITSLAAHGETLAVGCASGLIRVLTIVGGEYLNRESNLPVKFVSMLTGHSSKVMSLDLESDGQLVSGGLDRSVRIWDLNSGQLLLSLTRRWPGWGPVYSVAMLSAPLGTRCSIGEDTQGVAKAVTLKRKSSLGTHNTGGGQSTSTNWSTSSGAASTRTSQKGKKKVIAVATGDGGLRVWSLESLLSEDSGHRQQQSPACCRLLLAPRNEGLFGHSLQQQPNAAQTIRSWSVCTQLKEINNTNCFVTADTHGSVTIWCQLSWVKVMAFNTKMSISNLSVVRHCTLGVDEKSQKETLLILTNGSAMSGVSGHGSGQKAAMLHTLKMQQIV